MIEYIKILSTRAIHTPATAFGSRNRGLRATPAPCLECSAKAVLTCPRYFVLVPGAINLVQSPSYFDKLLDMGCPSSSLRLAGHWVSRLVEDRTFLTFAVGLTNIDHAGYEWNGMERNGMEWEGMNE